MPLEEITTKTFDKFVVCEEERDLVQWYVDRVLCMKGELRGYCATGSAEAILCGMWMARTNLSKGMIVFASEESNYSVSKAANIMGLDFVPVRTTKDGSMCMKELNKLVHDKNRDAFIVLTMGSAVRNAYDDVIAFRKLKFSKRIHVHVDAAFGGAVYPFTNPEMLTLNFDTFNVSLHKFWGAVRPCAIFLYKTALHRCVDGADGKASTDVASTHVASTDVALTDRTVSRCRDSAVIKGMFEYLSRRGFATRNMEEIRKRIALRDRYVESFKIVLGDDRVRVSNDMLSMSITLHDLPMSMKCEMRRYSMSVRPRPCNKRFDTHVQICSHTTSEVLDDLVRTIRAYVVEDRASGGCAIA